MKRSRLGGGLLLLLLIGSLLVTHFMIRVHEPIAKDLAAAEEFALAGNWDKALSLSQQAAARWEETETFRSCFADHNPMEEVDACFALMRVYGCRKEKTAFAAVCAETAKKVTAMSEAHKLMWHTFF